MKTKQYLFGTMLFCASAAFISCSSDDDDFTSPSQEEGLTTITVGAPTIEQDGASAKTRVAFTYDSGLTMAWEANDAIQIAAYPSTSGNRSSSADWYTTTGGTSATFTVLSGSLSTNTVYNVGYFAGTTWNSVSGYTKNQNILKGNSSDNPYYNTCQQWKRGFTISTSATQAGNDKTAHLKSDYMCVLQGVSTYSDPTFSSSWAESKGGEFYQSACLKLDLTLPQTADFTGISKLFFITRDGDNAAESIIKRNYDGSSTASLLTLNFSGLTDVSLADGTYHLIGYIMLSPAGLSLTKNHRLHIRVFNGAANKYLYRTLTIPNDMVVNSGTLGIIKLNSTGGWASGSVE